MISSCVHLNRRVLPALAALVLAAPAAARPLPDPALHVRLVAQDTPVGAFLQQLAAPANVSATVSPKITGSVSGVFDGRLDTVLAKVGKAFGAAYYYDGQTLAFYPTAERASQVFRLSAEDAEHVRAQALREGLTDADDTLQAQGGRLTAAGAPQFMAQVQALIHRLPPAGRATASAEPAVAGRRGEAAEELMEYRVYYLHYGWAADTHINAGDRLVTIPGVATILRALVQDLGDGPGPGASVLVSSKPAAQPGLIGSGLASSGQASSAQAGSGQPSGESEPVHSPPNTLAGLFGLAAATAAAPKRAEARRDPDTEPRSQASPFRVEADPRLNAVIVRDTHANLELYASLIAALDVEPTLVQIEATIIDVDIERAKQAGFNLRFVQPNGSGFSSDLDGVIPGFPQAGGLSASAVIGDKNLFIAKLEALESQGAARIVSNPLVMTLSDVEATFQSDQTFYVPVNGSLSTDLYNVTAGTNLRVTPHVTRDKEQDRIRLIVEIDDGSLSSQLVGAIPVVQKASLNTEALILSGQSLLVGGMVSQNETDSRARIPGVAGIPVLGELFRASRKTSAHTERLFLITPRLAAIGAPAVAPAGTQELSLRASPQPASPSETRR